MNILDLIEVLYVLFKEHGNIRVAVVVHKDELPYVVKGARIVHTNAIKHVGLSI